MIIAGFNNVKDNFVIENYPHLEKIVLRKNTLQELNSLKISNCKALKTIEVEDSDRFANNSHNGACFDVKNVIIESISKIPFLVYIFLIYNHSKQESFHSLRQQVYL